MVHVHRSRFSVRSYEVDSYSHLNNGVFLSWYEQSRLEYLQSLGYSYDSFAERKEWIVVARIEADFRLPAHLGDDLVVDTWIEGFGRTSVRFRQRMIRGSDELVCEAKTLMVFSGEGGGSVPIPEDFRAAVGPVGAPADA
ncbi:MAG: acyl-CoA thioesterase [Planctomycetota bacterium]|jgi:YbgC/YbaW family acyl-CoA thioester hydrolase